MKEPQLPKSFLEFCMNCPIKHSEFWITATGLIKPVSSRRRNFEVNKNLLTSIRNNERLRIVINNIIENRI